MTLVLKAEKQKSVLALCSPLFTTLETRRKFGQVKLRKDFRNCYYKQKRLCSRLGEERPIRNYKNEKETGLS